MKVFIVQCELYKGQFRNFTQEATDLKDAWMKFSDPFPVELDMNSLYRVTIIEITPDPLARTDRRKND